MPRSVTTLKEQYLIDKQSSSLPRETNVTLNSEENLKNAPSKSHDFCGTDPRMSNSLNGIELTCEK
jgi:hypothetical protein